MADKPKQKSTLQIPNVDQEWLDRVMSDEAPQDTSATLTSIADTLRNNRGKLADKQLTDLFWKGANAIDNDPGMYGTMKRLSDRVDNFGIMGLLGLMSGGVAGGAISGGLGALAPPKTPGEFVANAGAAAMPWTKGENAIRALPGLAKFGARFGINAGASAAGDAASSTIDYGSPDVSIPKAGLIGLLGGSIGNVADRIFASPRMQQLQLGPKVEDQLNKLLKNKTPQSIEQVAGSDLNAVGMPAQAAVQQALDEKVAMIKAAQGKQAYHSEIKNSLVTRAAKLKQLAQQNDLPQVKQLGAERIDIDGQISNLKAQKRAIALGYDPLNNQRLDPAYAKDLLKDIDNRLAETTMQSINNKMKVLEVYADKAAQATTNDAAAAATLSAPWIKKVLAQTGVDLAAERQQISAATDELRATQKTAIFSKPTIAKVLQDNGLANSGETMGQRMMKLGAGELGDLMNEISDFRVQKSLRNIYLRSWVRGAYDAKTQTLNFDTLLGGMDSAKFKALFGNAKNVGQVQTDFQDFLKAAQLLDAANKANTAAQQTTGKSLQHEVHNTYLGTIATGLMFKWHGAASKAVAAAGLTHLVFGDKLWNYLASNKGAGSEFLKWAQQGASLGGVKAYPGVSGMFRAAGFDVDKGKWTSDMEE